MSCKRYTALFRRDGSNSPSRSTSSFRLRGGQYQTVFLGNGEHLRFNLVYVVRDVD